jgi:TusE/DsrC/DsvC family sulfur relay protein
MVDSMLESIRNADQPPRNPDFPHAPSEWTRESALAQARRDGLTLNEDHWEVIRALQDYFQRHEEPGFHGRELHDALDEKFHQKGGIKYLYQLFPGGPIAQGCRMAGLEPPAGAVDRSFGSVM